MPKNPKYKCLIIDDEHPARLRLKQLICLYPDIFMLIGVAKNGIEAVSLIETLKPDLIFLDIQMPGLSGFEVLQNTQHKPLVIFCTAFDQFAFKAFEAASVDYLLKPVSDERFAQTVEKLQRFNGSSNDDVIYKLLQNLSQNNVKETPTSIPVKVGEKIIFIRLDDVSYFKADDKYVEIITRQAKTYLLDASLKKLEEKLPDHFLRVHRSYIINKNLLKEARKYFNNRFILIMEDYDQSKIVSGKSYGQEIKRMFEL